MILQKSNKKTSLWLSSIKTACLLAGSFISATNGYAQTSDSNPSLLETVVVSAQRQERSLADLSASVSVISSATNNLVAHIHPSQIMVQVPGAWVVKGNGQEHLTAIRSPVFTGAGSCGEYVVAEDGLPTRPVGFCNVNQLFEVHTEQAERIEVWRGTGAVVFGSNAVHGVINSITPSVNTQNHLSLEVEANDYARISLGLSDAKKTQRLMLQASSDGGYKDDSGFDQQKFSYKKINEGPAWHFKTVLSGSNLNQETAGFVEGKNAYRDSGRQKENPFPEAYRDAQSLRWSTTASRQINDDIVLTLTPYARYSDMEFMQHYLPGQAIENNDHLSAGIQSKMNVLLGSGVDISVGIDAEYADIHVDEYQPGLTVSTIDFLVATIPQGYHYDFDVTSQLIAPFFNSRFSINESTDMEMGFRYESVAYDYENRMLDGSSRDDGSLCDFGGCRFNRPSDSKDEFEQWNSQFSINHQFNDNLMAFLRYARGYRMPQVNELYRLQDEQNEAGLDEETVDSFEFGVRAQAGDLSIDAVTYWMAKDKVIFRDSNRTVVSDGETEHYGVETQLMWQLSHALSVGFNGAWSKHHYREVNDLVVSDIEDNHMDSSPFFTGQLELIWQRDELQAQIEWVKISSYYLDPENEHRYSGHSLVNLRASWHFDEKWSAQVRLVNLLDQKYADRADYAFGHYRYFIGEPLSGYFEVSYSF